MRSEGLQVAERTGLITSSGRGIVGGGDRARDERNRRGGGRIRGKKGVIERGEEEKKLSRTDREEVWDEERERETGRDEGKQLPAQVSLLCSAMHSVRGRAWKERGGQG